MTQWLSKSKFILINMKHYINTQDRIWSSWSCLSEKIKIHLNTFEIHQSKCNLSEDVSKLATSLEDKEVQTSPLLKFSLMKYILYVYLYVLLHWIMGYTSGGLSQHNFIGPFQDNLRSSRMILSHNNLQIPIAIDLNSDFVLYLDTILYFLLLRFTKFYPKVVLMSKTEPTQSVCRRPVSEYHFFSCRVFLCLDLLPSTWILCKLIEGEISLHCA